ncbi:MAG: ATP-binding protein, partial [Desulfatitalea sp.]
MPRRYRNRRIGEFLKELDLTEGRATGIPKILRAMKDNGSPPPEFEFDEDHSYFQVRLLVHPAAGEVIGQDGGKTTPPVTPPVIRLLELLDAKGASGNAEIRKHFGLKDRTHLRKLYIDPA